MSIINKNGIVYKILAKFKLHVLDVSGFYKARAKIMYRYVLRCPEPLIAKKFKLYSREVLMGGKYYSCNPSIAANDGTYLAIVRTVNYRLVHNGWYIVEGERHDTRNYLVTLSDRFKVIDRVPVEDLHQRNGLVDAVNGFEDLRIFIWKSEVWTLGNARNVEMRTNVMALQRIRSGSIAESYLIPSPFSCTTEKNWMPFVHADRLYAVHSLNPLIIVEIDKNRCEVKLSKDLNFQGDLFGSSQVVRWKSGWICVVHDRKEVNLVGRLYRHRFLYIDDDWNVTLSDPFCWKQHGVEFCCGLAFLNGKFAAAISVHDRRAFFVELDESVVEAILHGPRSETSSFDPLNANLPQTLRNDELAVGPIISNSGVALTNLTSIANLSHQKSETGSEETA